MNDNFPYFSWFWVKNMSISAGFLLKSLQLHETCVNGKSQNIIAMRRDSVNWFRAWIFHEQSWKHWKRSCFCCQSTRLKSHSWHVWKMNWPVQKKEVIPIIQTSVFLHFAQKIGKVNSRGEQEKQAKKIMQVGCYLYFVRVMYLS